MVSDARRLRDWIDVCHLTCQEVEGATHITWMEDIVKKDSRRLPLIFGVARQLTVCGSSFAAVLIKSKLITTSSSTS